MNKCITFGGNGGKRKVFTTSLGEAKLQFVYGHGIDSLQIDNDFYGGGGGSHTEKVILPPNGVFKLRKMQTYYSNKCADTVLSYLEIQVGKEIYKIGKESKTNGSMSYNGGVDVRLVSLNHSDRINAMEFEYLS